MKKLTVNKQVELFAQDCKLINLRYEYSGFTGTEKWAIITELSEEALWDKYPDVISRYTPFILLSMAQGEVISESHRNNDKYEKRSKRTIDVYGYEDDIFEQFHPKSIAPFIDPFDKAEEEQIEEEKEKLRQLELSKVRQQGIWRRRKPRHSEIRVHYVPVRAAHRRKQPRRSAEVHH